MYFTTVKKKSIPTKILHSVDLAAAWKHTAFLSVPLSLLQPHRPPCCSLNMLNACLPQDLCACCFLCLQQFPWPNPSFPTETPIKNHLPRQLSCALVKLLSRLCTSASHHLTVFETLLDSYSPTEFLLSPRDECRGSACAVTAAPPPASGAAPVTVEWTTQMEKCFVNTGRTHTDPEKRKSLPDG